MGFHDGNNIFIIGDTGILRLEFRKKVIVWFVPSDCLSKSYFKQEIIPVNIFNLHLFINFVKMRDIAQGTKNLTKIILSNCQKFSNLGFSIPPGPPR